MTIGYADNANLIKTTTNFVKSGIRLDDKIQTAQPEETEIPQMKTDYFEYYSNIDYNDLRHFVELGQGCANMTPTKERIAEYFGNIAKELDEVYSQGDLTKDEYDELNDMLLKQVENTTEKSERRTAFFALGRKRGSLSPDAAKDVILREKSMTPEEFQEDLNSRISEYVERFCKIDRESLMKLFNNFRYGENV